MRLIRTYIIINMNIIIIIIIIKHKRRHRWINLKEIKTNWNCGLINSFYYIDTSVLQENIPLAIFIKTTSGTRVVYFP